MSKVITDEKLVDELLERGMEMIYPDKKSLKTLLMSGRRIKLYGGFDPSAPALHIGNAILINKLSQFQALGHEVIFLVGDFTGMIGDPTDKSAARKKLTREEVLANAKNYVEQAGMYLKFDGDNPAVVRYNSEWSDKISFKDLIEITSNFTVQQMIQRDMFQKRIEEEKPIYLHEFLYPVAQGYDSVALDVDLELGGNDQMFNMMAGRDLMKAMKIKEKFVMTLKLLADETGKKMGKSEGNAVFLDVDPKNMYGIIMSWPDGVLGVAFELCTKLPMAEIFDIQNKLKNSDTNPRDLKMKLAFEITKIAHGEELAREAEENFVKTVQKKEVPSEVYELLVTGSLSTTTALQKIGFANSKSEVKRLIEGRGVKINGKVVEDVEQEITEDSLIQKGKRYFAKIVFKK